MVTVMMKWRPLLWINTVEYTPFPPYMKMQIVLQADGTSTGGTGILLFRLTENGVLQKGTIKGDMKLYADAREKEMER